jgi:hypothetical protein
VSLAFCVCFFFYFQWYLKRHPALRSQDAADKQLTEYRAEVFRLIAAIDAATDRDTLLVEQRIATLKKMLEDTDKRIAVYTRELGRSRSGEALYSSLSRGVHAALSSRPPAVPEAAVAAAELQAGAAADESPPSPAEAVPADDRKPTLKIQIAKLAAQGLSPEDIASRLDLSFSEVDLALNLLGKR